MSDERFEEHLREDFGQLRTETSARTPSFEAMIARARRDAAEGASLDAEDAGVVADADVVDISTRRRRVVRIGGWVSATAAAAAAVGLLAVGLRPGTSPGDAEFERLVASYTQSARSLRSPTAGLMRIPGVDLGSVPSVGGVLRDMEPDADDRDGEGRDS